MALNLTYLTDKEISEFARSPRTLRFFRDLFVALQTLDATASDTTTDLTGVQADADEGVASARAAMSLATSLARLINDLEHRPRDINYKMPAEYSIEYARSKADIGLQKVENTALSTWPGSTNIVTLGTIGGTLNATISSATAYSSSNMLSGTVVSYLRNSSTTNSTAGVLRLDATGSGSAAACAIAAVHTGDGASALVLGTRLNSGSDVVERVRIDPSGNVIFSVPATAPSLSTNLTLAANATSDTNLRFSVRGSDGVTRTANLTLA